MRRYSPSYYNPPRRGYGGGGGGGRGRSRSPPPRRGYGGGRRKDDQNNGSLLVRNIPLDCRPEELRHPFERFGAVRDVYIPKDYYTGAPRGFAFVQFVDPYDAMEAQHRMNGQIFAGRELAVLVALETRKRPEQMRQRNRGRGPYEGRPSYYGHSRSRSLSHSRSPCHHPASRSRYRSRSYSPVARRPDYSASPGKRHAAEHRRSPRGPRPDRDVDLNDRPYSPGYSDGDDLNENRNRYGEKSAYDYEEARDWRPSPRRVSRSPSGSRSRSADM